MRRQIFGLLALSVLLLNGVSCQSATLEEKTQGTDDEAVTNTSVSEGELGWRDILPQSDYNGETFTVLVETNANVPIWERYWTAEEDSGDVLSSAVYNRNVTVSEHYNINLEYAMLDDTGNRLYNSIAADEYPYNLAVFHMAAASSFVMKSAFMNWLDIDGVDFSHPWWSVSNVEDLAYQNVLFTAIGDYATSSLATTYCMFYNKNLAEDYQLGDIYAIVNEKKWTIDKLKELTKDIYVDLNMDGKAGPEDLYGFATSPATAIIAYNWALGGQIYKNSGDGTLQKVFMNERTVNLYEKVYSLMHESNGSYSSYDYVSPTGDNYHNLGRGMLVNRQAVFVNGKFDDALATFRNMEDDYGIIPYPMLDEAQGRYYTTTDAALEAMMIPINTPEEKLEMVAVLSEALCGESYETVTPAYYQSSLKDKAARDEIAYDMLDLIRDSRKFDFGYLYNFNITYCGYASFMENLMNPRNPRNDFVSYYEEREKEIDSYFTDVFEFYEDYILEFGD
ncbi:MAG: hypothetical protein IJW77_16650 [Clostridia bacterium]|nr:hypothetical protein [Clostridia bacterium]